MSHSSNTARLWDRWTLRLRTLQREAFLRRLVLSAGLLTMLVWMLLGVDLWRLHVHRLEDAQTQGAGVVRAMSERVTRSLRVTDQSLRAIEEDFHTHVSVRDPAQITRNLQRHTPVFEEVLTIALVDADGLCIAQSNPSVPTGHNYAASDFFRAHAADANLGLYIEQPLRGVATGKRVFTVSRRVTGDDGRFLGVLVAPILTDALATEFAAARIGAHGSIGLVHLPSNTMIARQPDYENAFAVSLRHRRLPDAVRQAHKGSFEEVSGFDGEKRMFAYEKIAGMPLAIAVGIAVRDIKEQLARDLAGYLLLAMTLTLIVLAGARAVLAAHRRETALAIAVSEKDALIGAFFAASPVGMFMLDPDLRYRSINKALADINGLATEESLGKTTREVVPALADQLEPVYRRVVETGLQQKDIQIAGETPSHPGINRHWVMSSFPITSPDGTLLGIGGVVLEVTERRQTEFVLRRWQQIYEHAEWGVAIGSADGKTIEMLNPAYARMHGYSVEELTGKPIEFVYAPEEREYLPASIALNHVEGHRRFETMHLHHDGHAFPVSVDVTTVRDDAGQVLYRVVNVQDLTKVRRTQDEARSTREFFHDVFDAAPIGKAIADLEGHYLKVNRAMCEFVGYTEQELLTMSFQDITHPEDLPANLELRNGLVQGRQESFTMEKRFVHKDGRMLWALLVVTVAKDASGRPAFTVGQMMDITERKERALLLETTQEELRALSVYHESELEEERRRIAREVHDELGQLLTALKMDISLIRLRFGADPELREKAEDMRALVEKTIQVVRHVASNLRPAALDLGLVPAIEWLAEDLGHRSEIECRVVVVGGEIALDDSRATAVFRVIQESLTNVIRHAVASKVTISLERRGDELHVRVQDNGRGFDPWELGKGSGFGLLGMRERMLALGGSLLIDSVAGKGAAIAIRLPMMKAGDMIRLLIADDHAIVRGGLKQIIGTTTDIVVAGEATHGTDVLEQLRRLPVDLLLLDMTMPGISGAGLIQQLHDRFPSLPILVLSMHNEGQIISGALKAGAAGYVTKDSEPEVLLAGIRKVAGGGRFIDPAVVDSMVFDQQDVGNADGLLTVRELQVLAMIASGQPLGEIADRLHLSPKTISTHKMRLMQKLKIDNNADLIRYAIRHGLVTE